MRYQWACSSWFAVILVGMLLGGLFVGPVQAADGPAVLVADIAPGVESSNPSDLTVLHNTLYFSATSLTLGHALWRSDGTAQGTSVVKAFPTPVLQLTRAQGQLFFVTAAAQSGYTAWTSDGTDQGTIVLHTFPADGVPAPSPIRVVQVGDTVYFLSGAGPFVRAWISDGTPAGTVPLNADPIISVAQLNGTLFFMTYAETLLDLAPATSHRLALWKRESAGSPPTLIWEYSVSALHYTPVLAASDLIVVGNFLFFSMTYTFSTTGDLSGVRHAALLWRSDGTPSGTISLLYKAYLDAPTRLGDTLFVTATAQNHELWQSNGTPSGTTLVKTFGPPVCPAAQSVCEDHPGPLINATGKLFFTVKTATGKRALWSSDGTTNGTVSLADAQTGGSVTSMLPVEKLGVIFGMRNDPGGQDVWQSDGTPRGTKPVQDIIPNSVQAEIGGMTILGTSVYFSANDGTHGNELWQLPLAPIVPPPVATDQHHGIDQNTTLHGSLSASASLTTTLTYRIVAAPQHGTVRLTDAATGAYTYTPTLDFQGSDTFTFQANDGIRDSNVATVRVLVGDQPLFLPLIIRVSSGIVRLTSQDGRSS